MYPLFRGAGFLLSCKDRWSCLEGKFELSLIINGGCLIGWRSKVRSFSPFVLSSTQLQWVLVGISTLALRYTVNTIRVARMNPKWNCLHTAILLWDITSDKIHKVRTLHYNTIALSRIQCYCSITTDLKNKTLHTIHWFLMYSAETFPLPSGL